MQRHSEGPCLRNLQSPTDQTQAGLPMLTLLPHQRMPKERPGYQGAPPGQILGRSASQTLHQPKVLIRKHSIQKPLHQHLVRPRCQNLPSPRETPSGQAMLPSRKQELLELLKQMVRLPRQRMAKRKTQLLPAQTPHLLGLPSIQDKPYPS